MSMNAIFVQVNAADLSRFRADPESVEALFENGAGGGAGTSEPVFRFAKTLYERMQNASPERLAEAAARVGKTPEQLKALIAGDDFLKQLESRLGARPARNAGSEKRETLSLDKAWHGVHYVLCGEPQPGPALLSQAVLGGTDIGDDDEGFSGYGPARYFTVAQTAELAALIGAPEIESQAAARFDAAKMSEMEIYPSFRDSDAEWVMDGVRSLRDFYADAAKKGKAIVTCLV